MSNETTLLYAKSFPINFVVSNSSGIEKGTILKLTDPMTASAVTANNDQVAGIAKNEKIANDGVTELAVYRDGIFKGVASGSIGVGDPIASAGRDGNLLYSVLNSVTASGSRIIGTSFEACTTGESFIFELNIVPRTEVR